MTIEPLLKIKSESDIATDDGCRASQ